MSPATLRPELQQMRSQLMTRREKFVQLLNATSTRRIKPFVLVTADVTDCLAHVIRNDQRVLGLLGDEPEHFNGPDARLLASRWNAQFKDLPIHVMPWRDYYIGRVAQLDRLIASIEASLIVNSPEVTK